VVKLEQAKSLKYFEGLEDPDLASIAARMVERTVSRNESIVMEGSACRDLHVVASGRVKIFKTSEEGREHIFYYAGKGEAFCETGILEGFKSPISATAVIDSTLFIIRDQDLKGLLSKIPSLALRLLRNHSERIHKLIEMVEGLSFRNVPGRLAKILVELVDKEGVVQGKNIILERNITLYEMASMVGTVREVITRSLQELERKGYLQVKRRQIEILDLEALKSLC
jgi:CRP/FNR family transcriptional regulator